MTDNVNHPAHYTGFSNGAEVIDITENLSFNLGNVVKYAARAGRKTEDPLEDLKKAQFYLEREIARLTPKSFWTLESLQVLREKEWRKRDLQWTFVVNDGAASWYEDDLEEERV
jgi:hypothetical protein